MKKRCILLSLILVPLLMVAWLPGAHSVQAAEADEVDIECVSQLGGAIWSIATEGSYAYIGQAPDLWVLDISDPCFPVAVGHLDAYCGKVPDIDIQGTRAYLAQESGGLLVVDITVPESPVLLGSCPIEGKSYRVCAKGDYAYVRGDSGLHIVDTSDAANPTLVGSYALDAEYYEMALKGDYVCLVAGSLGLQVIDVSDPAHPTLASSCSTGLTHECFYGVCISGDLAYVSCDTEIGWVVIDIGDPTQPSVVLTKFHGAVFRRSVLVGEEIYWLNGAYGLFVLDISDPTVPVVDKHCDIESVSPKDFCVADGYAYVVSSEGEMLILELDADADPTIAGAYGPLAYPLQAVVAGDYAYVAGRSEAFDVVDVSDLTEPVVVASLQVGDIVEDMDIAGDYVYLAADAIGLVIVDVSDPTTPTTTTYGAALRPRQIAVSGSLAYIPGGETLRILDVSDPQAPVDVATHDFGLERVYSFCAHGDYVFVREFDSLNVFDCSNPQALVEIGSIDLPNSLENAICFDQDYLYAVGRSTGLQIIDMHDPANPVQMASYNVADGYAIRVQDGHAYISGCDCLLMIVDVRDPANPAQVGLYGAGGSTRDVVVSGEHVYLPANYSGFLILQCGGGSLVPTPTPTPSPTPGPVIAWVDLPLLRGQPNIPGDTKVGTINAYSRGVCVRKDLAYVGASSSGLEIWDVHDVENPVQLGVSGRITSDTGTLYYADRLEVANGYAYVLGDRWEDDRLAVFDVHDTANPTQIALWDGPTDIEDVEVVGNYVYLACGGDGMIVLDVSNPRAPNQVASIYGGYGLDFSGVAISDGTAYLAGGYVYLLADVTDPRNPEDLGGWWAAYDAVDVDAHDEACFFIDGSYLVTARSLAAGEPELLGAVKLPSNASFVCDTGADDRGRYVFCAMGYCNGLRTVDVSVLTNPRIVASYDTDNIGKDAAWANDYLFFADGSTDLAILN